LWEKSKPNDPARYRQRFARLVAEFIDGCGFDPPLYVLAIGANGSISVARHSDAGVVYQFEIFSMRKLVPSISEFVRVLEAKPRKLILIPWVRQQVLRC
jgi:hypothetical protein